MYLLTTCVNKTKEEKRDKVKIKKSVKKVQGKMELEAKPEECKKPKEGKA